MNRSDRKSILPIILLLLLIVLIAAIVVIYFLLPRQLEAQFSGNIGNLSLSQRILYTLDLYQNRQTMKTAADPLAGEVQFRISQGESVELLCLRLEEQGLIRSAELFRIYLIYFGLDRNIQTGSFTISAAMSPEIIAQTIANPLGGNIIFSVLPGWRIEEIAASLPHSGLPIEEHAFIDYAYNPPVEILTRLGLPGVKSLEGFLYPGQYEVKRGINLDELVVLLVDEFAKNFDPSLQDAAYSKGLTPLQAVTMASIIERETTVDAERPLIASVFYNRLAYGMHLETDPTVQYAIGFVPEIGSWWKAPLYFSDLAVESPYNTYQNYGLPPSPISNPSLDSLQAAAYPAETPYFYFRAACDESKTHNFAITYEEHVNNACP